MHNHEHDLFDKIGLDAVAFLRFLHLLRWIFTFTALTTCGGLIPLDFLYTASVNPQNNFLSAMTIRDVRGVRLFAHIGSTYLITLVIAILVHHHWLAMYRLRNQWFRSPEYQNLFYARTLCITNIPERHRSDIGLRRIFIGMQLPYPVTSVIDQKAQRNRQRIGNFSCEAHEWWRVGNLHTNDTRWGLLWDGRKESGCDQVLHVCIYSLSEQYQNQISFFFAGLQNKIEAHRSSCSTV